MINHANQIVNQFGIKSIKKKLIRKGIYRITASDGRTFSLKSMPKQLARLRWMDRMLLRLRSRGLLIAWRNPQKPEGRKPYVKSKKGQLFVLTPWIFGRHPSPLSLSDMRLCGRALARFHVAGGSALNGKIAYNEIGKWYPTLNKRHRYIQNKIEKAKRNNYSLPISQFIKKNGPEFLRYANQSKALLKSSGYEFCRQNPKKYGVLCHGDGGPSNYILNGEGTYLIDFETLHVDLRAYDLYRVIYNSCKDYRWNFSIAKAILDGYREIKELNANDYKLMSVWLRFPFSTYLVMSPFKRIPFTKARLQWALENERRIGPFLQKLNNYAAGYYI